MAILRRHFRNFKDWMKAPAEGTGSLFLEKFKNRYSMKMVTNINGDLHSPFGFMMTMSAKEIYNKINSMIEALCLKKYQDDCIRNVAALNMAYILGYNDNYNQVKGSENPYNGVSQKELRNAYDKGFNKATKDIYGVAE